MISCFDELSMKPPFGRVREAHCWTSDVTATETESPAKEFEATQELSVFTFGNVQTESVTGVAER